MKSNYKRLGNYIHKVDRRNTDLAVQRLLGLSMNKEFRETTSNIVGTDMSVYKVMSKWQFACDFMSVIRVNKLPVVLKTDDELNIVSPAYPVFEVNDVDELHPEYLMMWFRRPEFDRYAYFKCDSAIRGGFDWEELCDVELPIPPIAKQKEIVKEYNVIIERIKLNETFNRKLEETAQLIYKRWFVDFEFPNELGKAYRSNGGEMEYNEELKQEIPKGWKKDKLSSIIEIINGYAFKSEDFFEIGEYPILKIKNITSPKVSLEDASYYSGKMSQQIEKTKVNNGDILISMTGSGENQMNSAVGKVGRYNHNICSLLNQRVAKLKPKKDLKCQEYLYYYISKHETQMKLLAGSTGSANQANISPNQIENLPIILPPNSILEKFEMICEIFKNKIFINEQINTCCSTFKDLILLKNTQHESSLNSLNTIKN